MGHDHGIGGLVIGQHINRDTAIARQCAGVVLCKNLSLDRVCGDQQSGVIAAVGHVGDAQLDRVHRVWIDIHLDRKRDGVTVHLGIRDIAGIVDVERFVRRVVDVVDAGKFEDRRGDLNPVDPDANRVVEDRPDIFRILLGREDELHRQRIAIGDETGFQDGRVIGGAPCQGVEIGIVVHPARIGRGVAANVGIARGVGEICHPARGQDDAGVGGGCIGRGGIAVRPYARGIPVTGIRGTDDLHPVTENGFRHFGRTGAVVDR